MILHRLRLTNFRGVADREIAFPDHGVVVVHGPNEIGKSSMLEALDVLLTVKDRSTSAKVKQIKPAHADVGAEVEAEISTGPYRFVYRKRFHKKTMTHLDIIEPKREQLSADQAHERVEAMLNETVDTQLWEAQRVLQAAATSAVNLSGSDALSRALDAAAGETDPGPSGTESLLIDSIDAEYLRYFTATGRPAKDWKTAGERLAAAEAAVARCAARVEEVDDRVRRHETATTALKVLDERLTPARVRVAAAEQAHAAVAALAEQLDQARLKAHAAAATSINSALANGQRLELISEVGRRADVLAETTAELAVARQQQTDAREAAECADRAVDEAAAVLTDAQQRLATAQATAQACVAREEADKLAARLRRIDDAEANLADLAHKLAAVTLTDEVMADIEEAAAVVSRLEALLEADAGTVEFTAEASLDIAVDGARQTVEAGCAWVHPATAPVVVEIPGVLSVRINPGPTAAKLRADLLVAQQVLKEALGQGGVSDVVEARTAHQRHQEITLDAGRLTAALEVLRDGDDVEQVRATLAQYQADAQQTEVDAADAAAELSAAAEALASARAAVDAQQRLATAAAAVLTEKSTAASVLGERASSMATQLAEDREKLLTLRAALDDDAVAAQAAADAAAQHLADLLVAALVEQYSAADPETVASELATAAGEVEEIKDQREAISFQLHTLTAELGVMGSEGRQGDLDEAEAELERARADHARLKGRARAAALLRDTMIRHRDNTRQRYIQPYRAELERLGRMVFGESFEVDVDAELTICTRTLDGCTVPFDSLSGGAKEQLGILARLAGAALVAKEDTVPVVIDDALGFSDSDRLDKMGEVFNTVGDRGQVIVLTCQPSRYQRIVGAEIIELSA